MLCQTAEPEMVPPEQPLAICWPGIRPGHPTGITWHGRSLRGMCVTFVLILQSEASSEPNTAAPCCPDQLRYPLVCFSHVFTQELDGQKTDCHLHSSASFTVMPPVLEDGKSKGGANVYVHACTSRMRGAISGFKGLSTIRIRKLLTQFKMNEVKAIPNILGL